MDRDLASLSNGHFDVLVIGGGITGAFIAWDAALRGLKTALIEKNDFGGATSAASSKLLHGGIRYLQQAHLSKVRESAMERAHFQFMAPHHSHYIPFLVPTYRKLMKSKLVMRSAMTAYQLLCAGEKSIIGDTAKFPPPVEYLSRQQALEIAPYIDRPDLTGAVTLPESHMHSSERMTLSVIKSAVEAGAVVANYTEALGYLTDRQTVIGCKVKDRETGDAFAIQAAMTINAAGPWIPMLDGAITGKSATTGYARGSHIVVSAIQPKFALALATTQGADSVVDRGGRHVFIIPWRGRALIGTSYASYGGELDELSVTESDISQLVDAINEAAPELALTRSQVDFAYCGLYPLQASDIKPGVYQGTGEYQLFDHSRDLNLDGVLTVLGAKFTTARRVAELALDLAVKKLGHGDAQTQTPGKRVMGGDIGNLAELENEVRMHAASVGQAEHMVRSYGTFAKELIQRPGVADLPISANQPVTKAEVQYIAEHEMAMTVDDVLFRRTGLGTVGHPGIDCVNCVADVLSVKLGWSQSRRQLEVERVARRWSYETGT